MDLEIDDLNWAHLRKVAVGRAGPLRPQNTSCAAEKKTPVHLIFISMDQFLY